jgi:hypothetical protein
VTIRIIKYILLLLPVSLLQGCFPEDEKVVPLDIELTDIPYSMYETQSWFRFSDMSVVAHNSFLDWDLGFESKGTGHRIILNTSRFMHAGNTNSQDFAGITSNICDTLVYDDSSGDLAKTAIGEWADFTDTLNPVFKKDVYIIDLGTDNNGVKYGYRKVTFDSFANNVYTLHFSNLDGTDDHLCEVTTDPLRSFTLFTFNNGGSRVSLQPPDSDWDICFTQYSTILYDDNNVATPYLVRGVYQNMNGVTAARDTINSFYSINAGNINDYTFSPAQDAIGYEWKDYKNDSYKINPNIFYIVKDLTGVYYKMKFAGFYNNTGEKGFPSFQCVRLTN